ncbi:MAG: hypothetical protein R3F19_16260 [Verrucomicrobiales bacterium]
MPMLFRSLSIVLLYFTPLCLAQESADVQPSRNNPVGIAVRPRSVVSTKVVRQWEFDKAGDTEGWRHTHACDLIAAEGLLRVTATGDDPYFHRPLRLQPSETPLTIHFRARGMGSGACEVYWGNDDAPGTSEARVVRIPLQHDGAWREYAAELPEKRALSVIRLDPGQTKGIVEFEWIRLEERTLHPLSLEVLDSEREEGGVLIALTNHGTEPLTPVIEGTLVPLAAGGRAEVALQASFTTGAFALRDIVAELPDAGLDSVNVRVPMHRADVPETPAWPRLRLPAVDAEVAFAPDGSGARFLSAGQRIGTIQPLLSVNGKPLTLRASVGPDEVAFLSENGESSCRFTVNAVGDLQVEVECASSGNGDTLVEGPVFRLAGGLEQGLFSGVEYLGKGEPSSSTRDMRIPQHVRFAPDRMWVTTPLIAVVSDKATLALSWDHPESIQPVFATPDFIDGRSSARMSLRGGRQSFSVMLGKSWGSGGRLEDVIERHFARIGFPEPPEVPRGAGEQAALCREAYEGPLRGEGGWGHCAGPEWGRAWYADHVSTLWRLTGQVPKTPRLVNGGAHISNPAAYFVTGRAGEWAAGLERRAARARSDQQADGSFLYKGDYSESHFEDTASGWCAMHTFTLLEHVRYTGNSDSLAAGLKGLEYMKRFRTPRGAQVWEVPLHTPDILASAHLVRAYVAGFELTGSREWLDEARRWAITGLPFVYTWDNRPIMRCATIAVLGATHYKAPLWIGLPVQWCGLSYAYALAELAEVDADGAADWTKVARGILVAAEQMQYPSGDPVAGCLPDSFDLAGQQRRPADINPSVLVALDLRLAGKLDSLSVTVAHDLRIVAPFPTTVDADTLVVQAQPGVPFELLVNGRAVPFPAPEAMPTRISLDALRTTGK